MPYTLKIYSCCGIWPLIEPILSCMPQWSVDETILEAFSTNAYPAKCMPEHDGWLWRSVEFGTSLSTDPDAFAYSLQIAKPLKFNASNNR
jgi:hypothetical protein